MGNGDSMAHRDRMRAHGCGSYLAVRLRRPKGGLPPPLSRRPCLRLWGLGKKVSPAKYTVARADQSMLGQVY